jgi:undecaprenyl-diphosphatase
VIAALLFKDQIEGTLRSLWFVAGALILWSGVMAFADHAATQVRHQEDVGWKDTLIIGVVQCMALIPGISRSGATMSAGLLRDLDRVTVTKLSFFLSIPALTGASILQGVEEADRIANGVGWTNTIVATVVSFVVAYASVTWLLKFVSKHSYSIFIFYRLALGSLLLVLLATNTIEAK